MPLAQFNYIFAIGTIFAFLDAWNIGANDVANAFATSVSSRSLTMRQAMCIASVMEFSGAVAVGARVTETIRTKIISPENFEAEPTLLMLGMMCAVIGSSVYLTIASKIGLPVSTTHSIMGGVIGVGIASVGASGINWGWSGVSQVFAAWIIAPGIAACFGAALFMITKYGVMLRKNPVKKALITIPIYFGFTSGLLTMLIVWKGAEDSITLSEAEIGGTIAGVAVGVALLVATFFLPYLYQKLVRGDWRLKWWHIAYGPLLLQRGTDIPPAPEGHQAVQDYYRGYKTKEEYDAQQAANGGDVEKAPSSGSSQQGDASSQSTVVPVADEEKTHDGPWYKPAGLWFYFKKGFFHGVDQNVVDAQAKRDFLSGDIDKMHATAAHYDNEAEYMYSSLQIMTAATASFAHGANDVSNAIGPYATIFLIWQSGLLSNETPVPVWILIFGGAGIVIGLWTYGYNIMRNLGNRITLHSPSRGFSMELGSAITVIMATRLALPVSTTQCITGATVGVGLCNGDWRTINWRMIAWIYMGWFITLPVTGIISGGLMGIIINAPQWGNSL